MVAGFADEVEAIRAAPVHHPGHCPSQGLHIHEVHPAKSTVMELDPHGRVALLLHGRQWCWGMSCSWLPVLSVARYTSSSFRQGQSLTCSRGG